MDEFKEIYLIDFSADAINLRTAEFETLYEAELTAKAFSRLYHPEEIKLLQVRTRFVNSKKDDKV